MNAPFARLHDNAMKFAIPVGSIGIVSQFIVVAAVINSLPHTIGEIVIIDANPPAGLLRHLSHRQLVGGSHVLVAHHGGTGLSSDCGIPCRGSWMLSYRTVVAEAPAQKRRRCESAAVRARQ